MTDPSERQRTSLRRVAGLVAGGADSSEVFAAVAEEVAQVTDSALVQIQQFEPGDMVVVAGSWGREPHPFQAGTRWSLEGSQIAAVIKRTGAAVRVDDFHDGPGQIQEGVRKTGIRGGAGAPIVVDGEIWGCMAAGPAKGEPVPPGLEDRLADFTELVATAIANAQARTELAASRARVVAAADEQRRRIVRDLHDGAQQRLVHTVITLKLALRELDGNERARELVDEALTQAVGATHALRELAHGILPAVLSRGGLRDGTEELASRMTVPVELDVTAERAPQAIEATAYFVIAEALTNVAKHARAKRVSVSARIGDGVLRLEVRDDGVGGADADGSGLLGLRDRVAALDGTLIVDSPLDGGTRISAELPVGAMA
jgi:signal transduction histidine kinase